MRVAAAEGAGQAGGGASAQQGWPTRNLPRLPRKFPCPAPGRRVRRCVRVRPWVSEWRCAWVAALGGRGQSETSQPPWRRVCRAVHSPSPPPTWRATPPAAGAARPSSFPPSPPHLRARCSPSTPPRCCPAHPPLRVRPRFLKDGACVCARTAHRARSQGDSRAEVVRSHGASNKAPVAWRARKRRCVPPARAAPTSRSAAASSSEARAAIAPQCVRSARVSRAQAAPPRPWRSRGRRWARPGRVRAGLPPSPSRY
mmetsp:Transcript_43302/g.106946  ORF Transcript_43302/g.106946 Transcript_43302/m.106946 type:complete len:256 (+) Transcript_43302:2258-3025(+)